MKKTISLVLALLMCAMLIPASAFADTAPLKTVTVTKTNVKAEGLFNADGLASVYTFLPEDDEWYTEDSVNVKSYGLMDVNGNMVIPYITPDWGIENVMTCSCGVYVNPSSGAYDPSEDAYVTNLYNAAGKKIGTLEALVKKYVKSKYGAELEYAHIDYAGPQSARVAVGIYKETGIEEDSFYREALLAMNLATGEVYYDMATYNPEEMGLAAATHYGFGAYSEGLINYSARAYDFDKEEMITSSMGYIDTNGKMVLNMKDRYYEIYPFDRGVALVESAAGKFGAIDKTGKEVIPCIYDDLDSFEDADYVFAAKDGKYGYIDKAGKEVVPFMYDDAYGAAEGVFTVAKNGKFGAVDKNNTVVVPFEYDDISNPEKSVMYAIKDGTVYVIKYADNAAAVEPETPVATDVKEKFGDVPATAWYGPFLQKAFDNGIVGGMSADKFGPDSNLTNAQIMVMVANLHAMQKGEKIDLAGLSDGTHWASAFRNYCKAEGIIDSRFDSKMDAKVNRGEMAYYFANAISAKSYADKNEANFSDVNGNAYAAEITKLAKAGIVGGFSDGTFKADQLVTRAQSCVFVSNLIDAMGK